MARGLPPRRPADAKTPPERVGRALEERAHTQPLVPRTLEERCQSCPGLICHLCARSDLSRMYPVCTASSLPAFLEPGISARASARAEMRLVAWLGVCRATWR